MEEVSVLLEKAATNPSPLLPERGLEASLTEIMYKIKEKIQSKEHSNGTRRSSWGGDAIKNI